MKRLALLAVVFSFLMSLVAGSAIADTKTHAASGLSVWVPDAWEMSADDDMMMVNTEDGLAVVFVVIEAKDVKEALDAADKQLAKTIENLTVVGEPKVTEINGLPTIFAEGKGTIKGAAVEVGFAIIDAPDSSKVLFVAGIGTTEAIKAHQEDLNKIFASIKPAK